MRSHLILALLASTLALDTATAQEKKTKRAEPARPERVVNLDFKNAPLSEALLTVAKAAKIGIVIDDELLEDLSYRKVTARFPTFSGKQALQALFELSGGLKVKWPQGASLVAVVLPSPEREIAELKRELLRAKLEVELMKLRLQHRMLERSLEKAERQEEARKKKEKERKKKLKDRKKKKERKKLKEY